MSIQEAIRRGAAKRAHPISSPTNKAPLAVRVGVEVEDDGLPDVAAVEVPLEVVVTGDVMPGVLLGAQELAVADGAWLTAIDAGKARLVAVVDGRAGSFIAKTSVTF